MNTSTAMSTTSKKKGGFISKEIPCFSRCGVMVAEVHRFMGGNRERHQVETRLPKGEYDDPSATVVLLFLPCRSKEVEIQLEMG